MIGTLTFPHNLEGDSFAEMLVINLSVLRDDNTPASTPSPIRVPMKLAVHDIPIDPVLLEEDRIRMQT